MHYGPTIAAAFGSPNEREIFQLRTVFSEMLKRSPSYRNQKVTLLQQPGAHRPQQQQPSPHSYGGPGAHPYGNGSASASAAQYNYSSNASTGMLYEQDTVKSSKSYGVLSTGPVERHSQRQHPSREAVA